MIPREITIKSPSYVSILTMKFHETTTINSVKIHPKIQSSCMFPSYLKHLKAKVTILKRPRSLQFWDRVGFRVHDLLKGVAQILKLRVLPEMNKRL